MPGFGARGSGFGVALLARALCLTPAFGPVASRGAGLKPCATGLQFRLQRAADSNERAPAALAIREPRIRTPSPEPRTVTRQRPVTRSISDTVVTPASTFSIAASR